MFRLDPKVSPSDQYTKLNDYELSSIYLEYDGGGRVDLKNVFQHFSFVEDITTQAMMGTLFVKDNIDLLNTFPISGHETLHVKFRTPGINSDFIEVKFRVIEVSDRVKSPNERGEVYKIKFVSNTAIENQTKKISKSFKGKVSSIARKIYNEFIGGSLNAQETQGETKCVIPMWQPFRALEWLASRAIPSGNEKETNYFFFETVDGHQFVSLSKLCSQKPVMTYYQIPSGLRNANNNFVLASPKSLARDFSNVRDMEFLRVNQKLEEYMDGAFASTLITHDVTTKSWGRKIFNYNIEQPKIRAVADEKVTLNNSPYTDRPQGNIMLVTRQSGLMGGDYPNTQNHDKWLQQSFSSRTLLNTIRTKVEVAGNSVLRVGDVVELFIPKSAPLKASDTEWYDERASGKYLITTVRHTLTPDEYKTTLILSKNSYEVPLPDEATFMGTDSKSPTNFIERK